MDYEPVIGLEAHAELDTATKLFCGCSTAFGAEPNTHTCPVCLGLPGALPVVNRRAFDLGLRAALALSCRIAPATAFDRKNYYYPDLPKNYQISQNYNPLGTDGALSFPVRPDDRWITVRILNVHLEEDAGKLVHPEDQPKAGSLVDLNRAGVPLVEIVTAPDLHALDEVESFMHALRSVLLYTEVSDCKMEEGSLRFEASISLRPAGSTGLGSRVEIKNLNSIAAVLNALRYEIPRQAEALARGEAVEQETRLWNDAEGRTDRMRTKEHAHDYRYFPEPDLVPVRLDDDWLAAVRRTVPELPAIRARRLVSSLGLSAYEADVLTADRSLADFFEAAVACFAEPKKLCNWTVNQLLAALNAAGLAAGQTAMKPQHFAELVRMVDAGEISARNAAELLPEMVAQGAPPAALVAARKLKPIRDLSDLETAVENVLRDNPKVVADWKAGKAQALNRLLGDAMRETAGRGNPAILRELLQKKLASM